MSTRVVVLREADLRMPFSVVLGKWYMGVIHLVNQDADPPSRKRGGSGSDVPWDEFSALQCKVELCIWLNQDADPPSRKRGGSDVLCEARDEFSALRARLSDASG